MSDESHLVVSRENANGLAKAENWIAKTAAELKGLADQEALVYLRSRGRDCHDQISAVIDSWKAAEQTSRAFERKGVGDEATNIVESFETFSTEAIMLRTVDWCKISGFEQWWRLLAQRRKEKLLGSGIEKPEHALYWLFGMVRSDYAVELMAETLTEYLDALSSGASNERLSGVLHAAAMVFAHHRLKDDSDSELVQRALETMGTQQQPEGGWKNTPQDRNLSVESSAMAVHALAVAQPSDWQTEATRAQKWLWSVQQDDGSWTDSGCNPVLLTVLVLDALALANCDNRVTFGQRPTPRAKPRREEPHIAKIAVHVQHLRPAAKDDPRPRGSNSTPLDAEGVTDPTVARLDALAEKTLIAKQRRAAVDAYIEEVRDKTGRVITRKEFWATAKYSDATEFERWQRNDPNTTRAACQAFERILTHKPHLKPLK